MIGATQCGEAAGGLALNQGLKAFANEGRFL
jgi:hypothetical protein